MKVVILAGGLGTRLAELTKVVPKPMVKIGELPIIAHIMNLYSYYGHNEFLVALGYKGFVIKEYFLNFYKLNSDFSIDLSNGKVLMHNNKKIDWNVSLIDTGLNTLTGGRLKKIQEYIGNEDFMLTYGDGLADIDINKILEFHNNHNKIATITAIRPSARFGELIINNGEVNSFKEKPQLDQGWINGGFFIFRQQIFDILEDNKNCILEREPLEYLARSNELMAYQHEGFWQCMDTKRDLDYLNEIWASGKAPWNR